MASVGWKCFKSLKYLREIKYLAKAQQKGLMDEKCQMDIVRKGEESLKSSIQHSEHQKSVNDDRIQMENKQKRSQLRATNTLKLRCNSMEKLKPDYFRPFSFFLELSST